MPSLQEILIALLVATVSLSAHEYAHARVAYALGDDTAALAGRMTMNPLAHLDPLGVLVFIFAHIGWARPVPVNPLRFTRPADHKLGMLYVSLAGPAANLLIALAASFCFELLRIIYAVSGPALLRGAFSSVWFGVLLSIVQDFYTFNVFLAIFNLLPVPPLDGYKIFGALLPSRYYYGIMRYERNIGLLFMVFVLLDRFLIGRIMSILATPIHYILWEPLYMLGSWILDLL